MTTQERDQLFGERYVGTRNIVLRHFYAVAENEVGITFSLGYTTTDGSYYTGVVMWDTVNFWWRFEKLVTF